MKIYIFILLIIIALILLFIIARNNSNVRQWLKWAVVQAEMELGSGTGQLKLQFVYNLAITQFPWIIRFVSYKRFCKWVDLALEWMKKQLDESERVKEMINNDSVKEEL